MSPLWSKFWRTAVLLPLSFLLSTIFNARRLEDSSYALWSALLLQLCDTKLDVFIICPQYALYVSPKAKFRPDDSFSSTLTAADNQAKGVVVDNCLIIPEIRLTRPSVGSLTEYLASFFTTRPSFLEIDVRTTNATVPIIVEQKRPPSRHPLSIYTYYRQIQNLLEKARSQAWDQGACLFSMPKFARQNRVMLIGASGAWWRFCLVSRPDTKRMVFDIDRYKDNHGDTSEGEPKSAASDDDENDDEGEESDGSKHEGEEGGGEEDSRFDVPTSPNQAKEVQMKYEKKLDEERTERRQRRQRIRDKSWESSDAKERLGQFIDSVGEGPYTMAQLDKCSELMLETSNLSPAPFCHQFDDDLRADDPRLAEWTKPMLLGTPISDKYMAFIKKRLIDLASKELLRRER
ncbi:hypothetical protein BDN71DRAFT_658434 [Pleurotus eryngii]|uniref:Uncharacterized protein n=1 Tax=Pleurotus eryngii TaxID=5323 RepID=A0A9P6DA26_PLEER|nr:hypothetical protein BDN71DRAFT_658434 [Pleurotus eryngii]